MGSKPPPAGFRFASAAEAGEAKAQHEYGLALVNGDGVALDRRAGADWLEKATAQGHTDGPRMTWCS